jgi:4-hydroxybenzoate polyprenyltransferase
MIALLFATLDEARPLLALLRAEKRLDQPFPTYGFSARKGRPGGLVIISGMGPDAAAAAAGYAVKSRGARVLVNPGICGSLSASMIPGTLHTITAVSDGEAIVRGHATAALPLEHSAAWPHLPAARLATVGTPVFGGAPRAALAAQADLVDMEGHAVARVAAQHAIPCHLLKGVSDGATESGRDDLHRNLARVAEALAQQTAAGLEALAGGRRSLAVRMANFVKVEHTLFSLPLLFAGAWLAAGHRWPGGVRLALIALAGLGARTLGMAMNRILDRHLDLLNPRTSGRDLPRGSLTLAQGGLVAAIGLGLYLLACAALGPVCLRWSPLPALVLISYSLLKRFTPLCHYGIGICLALGPLGAHVAVTGNTTASPALLLLALFTFCWISGSDIMYALQDMETDRETGVHSLPASFGPVVSRAIAAGTHLVAAVAAILLWRMTGAGVSAGVALAVTLGSLALIYHERWPLSFRFFPISALAGMAGAMIPLLGGGP